MISDIVEFFPQNYIVPKMSSTDSTINTVQDLIHELQNPAPVIPLVILGNYHTAALRALSKIFYKSIPRCIPMRVVPKEMERQHQTNIPKLPNHAEPTRVTIVEACPE